MIPAYNYQLFGWRLSSDVPLPELLPLAEGGQTDILVRTGDVPPLGSDAAVCGSTIQFDENTLRLEVPGVARYRLDGTSTITIEAENPETADTRLFLLGTMISVLAMRRGILPLHASAVEADGRTILITGASGIGKSTLAAIFIRRGHRLVSDDVCMLEFGGLNGPCIWPSFPRLKLWQETATHLGVDTDRLQRVRSQIEKYSLPVEAFRNEPIAPSHVVFLRSAHVESGIALRRLDPAEAMARDDIVHRHRLALALGLRPLMFRGMAALVRGTLVSELSRTDDLSALSAVADAILGHGVQVPA